MKLNKGDYVVATAWGDGNSKDPFCIGFIESITEDPYIRYFVIDGDGRNFRCSGYQRARRIRYDVGKKLVDNTQIIAQSHRSVWSWVRAFEREHED